MDDWQLWQRMLEIQRTFHCYNSARMSAALLELEMGVDAGHLARTFSLPQILRGYFIRSMLTAFQQHRGAVSIS